MEGPGSARISTPQIGLSREESFPKVDGATNPKKLAGNKHHKDGDEEQVTKASVLVGVCDSEGRISKDQPENDSDSASVIFL